MAEKLAEVQNDNAGYREKKREHEQRIRELEARQVPEGAVVLTGDDAKLYQDFRNLNLKPDELKTKLDEGTAAATERDQLKRSDALRKVARTAGYREEALADFDRLEGGLEYVEKDVSETRNGRQETVKRVFVKGKDGNEVLLGDYVKQQRPHLESALAVTEQAAPERHHGTPRRDVQQRQADPPAVAAPAIRL
jgi:hypothetical protein